mgnify:CR=1 FL=1
MHASQVSDACNKGLLISYDICNSLSCIFMIAQIIINSLTSLEQTFINTIKIVPTNLLHTVKMSLVDYKHLIGNIYQRYNNLFEVYRPTSKFFTHMETSPLPVKGCTFLPMLGMSSQGSLACHTYCDTGHPFKMVISEDP